MTNRYGLKADHWCNPTLNYVAFASCKSRTLVWQPQYNVLYQFNTIFWYVVIHCASPDILPRYPIVCLRMKIASVLLLLGMNPNYIFHECPSILAI